MIETLSKSINVKRSRGKPQPLYEQIREQIHHMVKSGSLEEGSHLPSISALSQKLRVNYRTVKSALNLLEKDGIINFEPNRRAVVAKNGLARPATEKIVMSYIRMQGDSFGMSISNGIKKFTDETELECLFTDGRNEHRRFLDAIEHPGDGVSGLLIVPFELPEYEQAVRKAIEKGLAVVFVDRILPNLDVSSVSADHFMGAFQATHHLLENNDRPVYYVGTATEPSSCRERVRGWRSAMHEYSYVDCDSYIFNLEVSEAELASSAYRYLDAEVTSVMRFFETHNERLFSIFAGNDYTARAIYIASENLGLKIGEDVFVVGFGNLPLAERLSVPLSSVEQNSTQVGYEAAKVMYELITGTLPKPVHRVLPVELNIRQSSTGVKASK